MSSNAAVSHTKKRKANDGRATVPDGAHDVNTGNGGVFLHISGQRGGVSSGPSRDENNASQLDRMEQIMMRMEEKLATVSSLESRCEQLESKCSSLETLLESTSRIDKTLKYHEMLIRNQKWEYSAPVYTEDELADAGYDDDDAEYIYGTSRMLKLITEAMRRGDFPEQKNITGNGDKGPGICLYVDDSYPIFGEDTNNKLSPHWREFVAALENFKPAFDVLPDDSETCIAFVCVQLNQATTSLIKNALVNMPFKIFSFQHKCHFHGGMSTIATMISNNKYLQQLDIYQIQDMDRNDITKLSSAIHHHPSLVDVAITDCFSNSLGDEMLHSLLRTDELKLEKLTMSYNHLERGINVCTLLADYLATNPRLKELDLQNNMLDDWGAELIANALRSNTTLRQLNLYANGVGEDGHEALKRALYDESSLNSVADSNHSCRIDSNDDMMNYSKDRDMNRAEKLYRLLSWRNKTMSNVQHFSDIDVKLLPNVLEAVQKYSKDGNDRVVKAASIVYEIFRCWEKVSLSSFDQNRMVSK